MSLRRHTYFESPATTWITSLSYSLPHKGGGSSEGIAVPQNQFNGIFGNIKAYAWGGQQT